jgi:hypothetical protein
MSNISDDIEKSFDRPTTHSYAKRKYHIIPPSSLPVTSTTLRIGLISFGLGEDWREKIQRKEIPRTELTLNCLFCDSFGHGYFRFFFKALREFANRKVADFFVSNEYSFPSFFAKCPKNMKHSHRQTLEKLINLVKTRKVLLFPGTLNVCDKSIRNTFGYSQGYLMGPTLPAKVVRKFQFAQRFDKKQRKYVTIEEFKRNKNFRLHVFRTEIGNFGISICSDFIDESQEFFFKETLKAKPNPDFPEMDLLIVPAHDRSGHVKGRAKELSKTVSYGIAWINSIDVTERGDDAQGLFWGGVKVKPVDGGYKYEDKSTGYKAHLKVFEFDLAKSKTKRFRNLERKPRTRKLKK